MTKWNEGIRAVHRDSYFGMLPSQHALPDAECEVPLVTIIVHPLRPSLLTSERGLPGSVKAERLADLFAANLLMPKRHVKRLWGEGARDAVTLAEHFLVSPRAMEVRLSQLGLVEPRQRCWPDVRDGRHYNRPLPVPRSLGLAA